MTPPIAALYSIASARISDDGRYRYRLVRRWADGGSTCAWIMLNPSTADASIDDPTIRKCVSFAKRWGHSAIEVVNLFAFRATDPGDLPCVHSIAVGPDNDERIGETLWNCHAIVCAWGTHGATPHADGNALRRRDLDVLQLIRAERDPLLVEPMCLGTNKNGTPKHPLYVALATPLVAFEGAS